VTGKRSKESFRGDQHAQKYATRIFAEQPAPNNPYCTDSLRCYGYDQLELIEHLSFAEYLFLLLRGRLPVAAEASLLNAALIAFSNPGVRHPATRAAVTAGVGKTVATGVLPAALMVFSGEIDAAGSVEAAMRYLRKAHKLPVEQAAQEPGFKHVFGLYAGSASSYLDAVCDKLVASFEHPVLSWGQKFLNQRRAAGIDIGWLQSGLLAATLVDLGILPRLAPGVMQLFAAPGLLAQGMENAHKPTTAMPFVSDDNCEIERGEQ